MVSGPRGPLDAPVLAGQLPQLIHRSHATTVDGNQNCPHTGNNTAPLDVLSLPGHHLALKLHGFYIALFLFFFAVHVLLFKMHVQELNFPLSHSSILKWEPEDRFFVFFLHHVTEQPTRLPPALLILWTVDKGNLHSPLLHAESVTCPVSASKGSFAKLPDYPITSPGANLCAFPGWGCGRISNLLYKYTA